MEGGRGPRLLRGSWAGGADEMGRDFGFVAFAQKAVSSVPTRAKGTGWICIVHLQTGRLNSAQWRILE